MAVRMPIAAVGVPVGQFFSRRLAHGQHLYFEVQIHPSQRMVRIKRYALFIHGDDSDHRRMRVSVGLKAITYINIPLKGDLRTR